MIGLVSPSLSPTLALAGSHASVVRGSLESYPEFDGSNGLEISAVVKRNAAWISAYRDSIHLSHEEHIAESASELSRVRKLLNASSEFTQLSESERDAQIYQLASFLAHPISPREGSYIEATISGLMSSVFLYTSFAMVALILHLGVGHSIDRANPQYDLWAKDLPRMFPAIFITIVFPSLCIWLDRRNSKKAPEDRVSRNPHDKSWIGYGIQLLSIYGVTLLFAFDTPLSITLPAMLTPTLISPFLYKLFEHPHNITTELIWKSDR